MHRVFNDGIGMVLVVERNSAQKIISLLESLGEDVFEVGLIETRLNKVEIDELNQIIENRQ